jgi:hypothetical protein
MIVSHKYRFIFLRTEKTGYAVSALWPLASGCMSADAIEQTFQGGHAAR